MLTSDGDGDGDDSDGDSYGDHCGDRYGEGEVTTVRIHFYGVTARKREHNAALLLSYFVKVQLVCLVVFY